MKKIISILLCAAMLSVYLTVFSVPAMALNNDSLIRDALENVKAGDTINISGNEPYDIFEQVDMFGGIEIKVPCTINIEACFFNATSYCDDVLFYVNADDVTLNFKNCRFYTEKTDNRGAAIYVNGKNCVINGNNSTEFNTCSTSARYGGAIYVNKTGCRIRGCRFKKCCAAWYGGAIYVADRDCVITNCTFNDCKASGVNSFVYSWKEDTIIVDGAYCNTANCPYCTLLKSEQYYGADKTTNRLSPAYPENGYYVIRTALDTDYCLDISGGENAKSDGDNLHLWPVDTSTAKIFKLEKDYSGTYKITAVHSGKVLDIEACSLTEGTNISQFRDRSMDNQRWLFESCNGNNDNKNRYYIHALGGGNAGWMDAAGCVNGNMPDPYGKTNVYSWSYTGNPNQQWILEKVDYNSTASDISEGSVWIVAAIGAVVVIGFAAVVISKKKKKETADERV